jgi:hypothetical protein
MVDAAELVLGATARLERAGQVGNRDDAKARRFAARGRRRRLRAFGGAAPIASRQAREHDEQNRRSQGGAKGAPTDGAAKP